MPSEKHILVFLSECEPGTEDAFNDWYTNTHLDEVTSVDGFVSARRYELAPMEPGQDGIQRYLAIYEVEGDPQQAKARMSAGAANRVAPVGLDRSRSVSGYYTLTAENRPASAAESAQTRFEKRRIDCPCGEQLEGTSEDDLVNKARAHLQERHPDLTYDREQILFMAY